MIDVNAVKSEAEAEVRKEKMEKAKDKIVGLIRKVESAKQVLINCEKELADAYATIGEGSSL